MTRRNDDEIDNSSAPLIEHLAELRSRIIWSLLAFLAGMILCFTVAPQFLDFLAEPISAAMRAQGQDPQLIFTAPQEKFFVLVRISVLGGLAVSFPVIAYQLWRFVAPGLYRSEKNAFLPFVIASPALFVLGAAVAHYIVTPMAMRFFIGFADAIPRLAGMVAGDAGVQPAPGDGELKTVFLGSVRESLDISLKFIFAFGLCFQLPVLLTLMGKAGLISAAGLAHVRKYAIVAILVLAAILTPPDALSQMILFFAVYPLYEISILLVRRVEKRRAADLKAQGLWTEADEEAARGTPAP